MTAVVLAVKEMELNYMYEVIRSVEENASVNLFFDPLLALRFIQNNSVEDVFVSDIINRITFVEFIRVARNIHPGLQIAVFSEKTYMDVLARASGADVFLEYPPNRISIQRVFSACELG